MTPIGASIIAFGVATWICTIIAVALVIKKGGPAAYCITPAPASKAIELQLPQSDFSEGISFANH
jgi:hypothetical protein